MPVKAVDMVRKIRDQHYYETMGHAVAGRIKFVKKKAEKLQKQLDLPRRGNPSNARLVGSGR